VERAQGAFGCPVFFGSFYLVSRRAKAVDSQTLQQRNASRLVSQINVNSGRAIEPASLEMMARARATTTSPSNVAAFTFFPEDVNLASLRRDFLSNPSPKYLLLLVSAPTLRSPSFLPYYKCLESFLGHLLG
jgi:hypothetical protein